MAPKPETERPEPEDTFERDAIKCPYCGAIEKDDLWELHGKDWEDSFEFECGSCEKVSHVSPSLTIWYTATPKEADDV